MIPWLHIDSAVLPGGGELRLKRRGAEFSIMAGTTELMNSRLSGSEQALATLAADRLDRPSAASHSSTASHASARPRPAAAAAPGASARPKILIGGLGMGFTLRAALARFGPDTAITVAELVPAVIAWARGPMAELFDGCLDDPRVTIAAADVTTLIRAAGPAGPRTVSQDRNAGRPSPAGQGAASPAGRFDAILLDVDNGPEGLTRAENDRLYSRAGLAAAKAALIPGGVLAVWSQGPNPAFATRLAAAGFAVDENKVRAHGSGGRKHVVWVAQA